MGKTKLLKVAIVGRPNVGKSSLFNRIVGSRKAIVEPASGTTRDRIHADIKWKGKRFTLIDMAGFDSVLGPDMSSLMLKQVRKGIEEADVLLFVTDGVEGVTPQDRDMANMLRKASKKLYLVVNKVDSENDRDRILDFFELGLGEPYAVSAMHDIGVDRLCGDIVKDLEKPSEETGGDAVKVAIIGRPNVGKSSYLNAILNEERAIVHATAGTTRDAIDTDFSYNGRAFVLIDTAGIRHHPKLNRAADFYAGVRSEEAITRADVAIMLIDAQEGLKKDDARIIDHCTAEGKPMVIAVNKWDLVKAVEMSEYTEKLGFELPAIRNMPIIFISCKTGRNVKASFDIVVAIYDKAKTAIDPDKLAETLKAINIAPPIYGKKVKFKCLVQESSLPMSLILGGADSSLITDNMKKYLENFIRRSHDLKGVPIRIRYR